MNETTANRGCEKGATDVQTGAPLPRLFDLKGAAKYTSLSYWTLREYVFSGVLPSVKLPHPRSKDGRVLRRILLDRKDLDALIDSSKEVEFV